MRIESRAFHKLGRHGTSQGFAKRPAMYLFLSILYVLVCLFLILVVLLQPGRGGIGGAFGGGSSQTVFGGSGAGNFLTRLTSISAALFMLLSASLAYMSSSSDKSLLRATEAAKAKQEAKAKREADKKADEPKTDEGASAPLQLAPPAPIEESPVEAPAAPAEPAAEPSGAAAPAAAPAEEPTAPAAKPAAPAAPAMRAKKPA